MSVEFTPVENLLLNMSSGLLPEFLTANEVNLLSAEFGENWFYELGYDDSYVKPKFEEE